MKTILLALLLPMFITAQRQEQRVIIQNIGLGGLTSAIGAVINKPKNTDWKKSFVKGFWQGAIGGGVIYGGKKTLHLINSQQNKIYAVPATIIHAAGYSIVENAAAAEPFLQNWNFDYGPVKINFSINHKEKFKVRLLPLSIYAAFYTGQHGRFDLGTSLLTGSFVFSNNNFFIVYNDRDWLGYSVGRSFAYVSSFTNNKYNTIAHELVHVFQFREHQVFNSWIKPLSPKIKSKTLHSIFSKYVYLDLPYHWPFYLLEGIHNRLTYFRNFYEFEAERIATNRYVMIL